MSQQRFTVQEIKNYLNEHSDIANAYGLMTEEGIIEANLWHVYNVESAWGDEFMTLPEFMKWVKDSNVSNDQIVAHPAIKIENDVRYNKLIKLNLHYESFLSNIPDTCTHVVWFSK